MTQKNINRTKYLIFLIAILMIAVTVIPTVFVARAGQFTDKDISSNVKGRNLWYLDESFIDLNAVKANLSKLILDKNHPILIGVIDTGINANHEVFDKTLYWVDNGSGGRKPVGYNSGNPDANDNFDDSSNDFHGTHVAGIISLMILELGLEDYVKIIPIKAAYTSHNESYFTSYAVDKAIRWANGDIASDLKGESLESQLGYRANCAVLNMSLSVLESGIGEGSSWVDLTKLKNTLIKYQEKTVYVAATGNKGKDLESDAALPAALPEIISVMNYNQLDDTKKITLNSTSNYGNYDLAAPGTGIYSSTSSPSVYGYLSGTSMSAPFVTMAAGLLRLRYPEITASKITKYLKGHSSNISTSKGSYFIKGLDLKEIMTHDFLNDVKYNYVVPTKVYVECISNNLEQNMAIRQDIKFNAKLAPFDSHNFQLDKKIVWYKDGYTEKFEDNKKVIVEDKKPQVVGHGNDFVYDDNFNGGQYVIYATFQNEDVTLISEKFYINIKFTPFDFQNIYITPVEWVGNSEKFYSGNGSNVPAYVGSVLNLSFTNVKNCDQTKSYKWYVDGKFVHEGVAFDYKPTTMGEHIIQATIDGFSVREMVINVKGPYHIGYVIALIEMGFAVVVGVLICLSLKKAPFVSVKKVNAETLVKKEKNGKDFVLNDEESFEYKEDLNKENDEEINNDEEEKEIKEEDKTEDKEDIEIKDEEKDKIKDSDIKEKEEIKEKQEK